MRRTPKILLTTLVTASLLLGGGATAASAGSPSTSEPSAARSPAGESAAAARGTMPGSPKCRATLGNLLRTYKNGKWATLEIFWDGKHKTNCAYLRHGPKVPGGKHLTWVTIWTCKTSKKGKPCGEAIKWETPYWDDDVGSYKSYAGKVSAKGVGKGGKPKCIYAQGLVRVRGKYHYIDVNGKKTRDPRELGKHCG